MVQKKLCTLVIGLFHIQELNSYCVYIKALLQVIYGYSIECIFFMLFLSAVFHGNIVLKCCNLNEINVNLISKSNV